MLFRSLVTQVKYISAFVDVSSVMPIFVAFVAFVALAAEPSIDTPFKVWLALARFNAMPVVPM